MRINKKIFLLVVMLAGIALLPFSSCAKKSSTSATRTVWKMLVPASTASFPLMLLAEQDPLEGIDLQVEILVSHPKALAQLLNKQAEFLFTGTSQGWESYLSGSPLVCLNTAVWGVSCLMGRDRSIRSFADLKNKSIALPFSGSPLDLQTRYILRQKGLDPDKDLSIEYMTFAQAVVLLDKGQLDVAALPEPLASNMEAARGLLRLVDYAQAWAQVDNGNEYSPQVSLFSLRGFAQLNRGKIIALNQAWQQAVVQLQKQPEQLVALFSSYLPLSRQVMLNAIGHTLFYVPSFQENRSLVTDYYHKIRAGLPTNGAELDPGFFF